MGNFIDGHDMVDPRGYTPLGLLLYPIILIALGIYVAWYYAKKPFERRNST